MSVHLLHVVWVAVAAACVLAAAFLLRRKKGGMPDGPALVKGEMLGGRFVETLRPRASGRWRGALAVLLAAGGAVLSGSGALEIDRDRPDELVVALDLSDSMMERDVRPSRLEAGRRLARRVSERLPGIEIGLVGFAEEAVVLSAPSSDLAAFTALLQDVRPSDIAGRHARMEPAIERSLAAFSENAGRRALLIITDGQAQAPPLDEAAAAVRRAEVSAVVAGFGSAGPQDRAVAGLAASTGGIGISASDTSAVLAQVEALFPDNAAAEGQRHGWALSALLTGALVMAGWSLCAEHPAMTRSRRSSGGAAGALVIAVVLGGLQTPQVSAQVYQPPPLDMAGEVEPLILYRAAVRRVVAHGTPDVADYLELARTAARYGEVHRGHSHPISEGVLRDGLEAVARGRALDPGAGDWDDLERGLRNLLRPPPPVLPDDLSEADAANEPMDARMAMPMGDPSSEAASGEDDERPPSGEGGQQAGGGRREAHDPSEWRNAELVRSLHELARLRREASPIELLRSRRGGQTVTAGGEGGAP
jgi:hypothetical protein